MPYQLFSSIALLTFIFVSFKLPSRKYHFPLNFFSLIDSQKNKFSAALLCIYVATEKMSGRVTELALHKAVKRLLLRAQFFN